MRASKHLHQKVYMICIRLINNMRFRFLFVFLFFLLLTFSTISDSVRSKASEQVTLIAIADSVVMEYIPAEFGEQGFNQGQDQNFGDFPNLLIYGGSDQNGSFFYNIFAFIKFDLSSIPVDSSLDSATLKLCTTPTAINETTVAVFFCPVDSWTELGITYKNQPPFDTNPLDTITIKNQGLESHSYSWNVINACKTAWKNAEKKVSFVIKNTDTTFRWASCWPEFYSRGSETDPPQLIITYTLPEPTPPLPVAIPIEYVIIAIVAIAVIAMATYWRIKK